MENSPMISLLKNKAISDSNDIMTANIGCKKPLVLWQPVVK